MARGRIGATRGLPPRISFHPRLARRRRSASSGQLKNPGIFQRSLCKNREHEAVFSHENDLSS
jgi:hypothetical protein